MVFYWVNTNNSDAVLKHITSYIILCWSWSEVGLLWLVILFFGHTACTCITQVQWCLLSLALSVSTLPKVSAQPTVAWSFQASILGKFGGTFNAMVHTVLCGRNCLGSGSSELWHWTANDEIRAVWCSFLYICIETNVVNVIYIPDELVLKNL